MQKTEVFIILFFVFLTQCYCERAYAESQSSEDSAFPLKDYSGDFSIRSNLLGDWGGRRNELAEKGLTFETDVTQVFQGNARGGKKTSGAWGYSGSADYRLKIDTQRMSL